MNILFSQKAKIPVKPGKKHLGANKGLKISENFHNSYIKFPVIGILENSSGMRSRPLAGMLVRSS